MSSGGLGGLNKSPNGIVLGCVQLQLPVVKTKDDLAKQTSRIVEMVGKARRNLGTMDLVIFPEYSLHGLSMDTNPEIMCRLDGPEVQAFKAACVEHKIWGCFSIMEYNPDGNPYNTGLVIDDTGKIVLYYRKLHPWIPVEPWEPEKGTSYAIRGGLGVWAKARLPSTNYDVLAAEFGTVHVLQVVAALQAENRAHHWGGPDHPATSAAKEALRDAFAPPERDWRDSVVPAGMAIVQQAIESVFASDGGA